MDPNPIAIGPEVQDALAAGMGVVALESTLVAQGLPWPENIETARESEAAVRKAGSVPATIAVFRGKIRVGLSDPEIEEIARSGRFLKASRRDLGGVVARGLDAATTVSATLRIARLAGIRVLATGGLGGVHRGAAETFDISTDLDELARSDGVLVVCSGVKSILDVPATLETLETLGVPVVGYRTDTFPAFTTLSSGLAIELRVDSAAEAASILSAHRALNLPGALILAQTVPEALAIDSAMMETALAEAMLAASRRGITGKAITPFLLDSIRGATAGLSLIANRALIVSNAQLAGEVAAIPGLQETP